MFVVDNFGSKNWVERRRYIRTSLYKNKHYEQLVGVAGIKITIN